MSMDFKFIEKNKSSITLDVCEGVKRLECLEIDGYYPVTEVNIPASVESIDFQVAAGMEWLERFNVSPENKNFVEVDGCVYSSDLRTLIVYPPAKECDCFEILSTVESIAPGAFWGATHLKCVKVGKSVKSIGYEAFAGAFGIERIYIDDSVDSIDYLLEKCDYLDLYILSRQGLVIGGKIGSAIEHWCHEHAVRFCSLNDDQVEDFLDSSKWNDIVAPVDYNECMERLKKTI